MGIKDRKIKVAVLAGFLSIITLLMFHFPFFRHAAANVEKGFNGTAILVCLGLLMLAMNYAVYYIVLYLGRFVGKIILGATFIINAICLYFINTYDVYLDDTMMGNVFHTKSSEAFSYYSPDALLYILVFGILPCLVIFLSRLNYGSVKKFFKNVGISLLVMLALGFGNMTNWPWIDKNSTVLGSLILPWSYIVNSIRFSNQERRNNKEEILLPDARISDNEKGTVVLVIGESSRRDHFSLYGYGKQTNPLLSQEPCLKAYPADASATYTTAGVKAILDHKPSKKLYEILPNYLYRAGADVWWRTSNWGQSTLHIEHFQKKGEMAQEYPGLNVDYDEMLLEGLPSIIGDCEKDKQLIILHTSTSHGPSYNKKYPQEFTVFTPVSNTVEMSTCSSEEILNAYDNSIVYTDYILEKLIGILKAVPDRKCAMIFVSDHGESLGENNLYMHGVPISVAPREQIEIPFLIWSSDSGQQYKELDKVTQYHVFHSVLHFLGIESEVYNEDMNLFK